MGVGMPHHLFLNEFGSKIWDTFGVPPYHVGSSLDNKTWRDVDVRLILSDEEYEEMGFGKPDECLDNPKWISLCMAFSALGEKMTGLPIDFQIQQQSDANLKYKGHRSSIGLIPLRFKE